MIAYVESIRRLNILTIAEYKERFHEDSRLPSNPCHAYPLEWKNNGKWKGLLGLHSKCLYSTWDEASAAAIALEIKTSTQYFKNYKKNSSLPSSPNKIYSDVWEKNGSWKGFLDNKSIIYSSFELAAKAAQKLKIATQPEYTRKYKEDSKLPSNPRKLYSDSWDKSGGWDSFLNRDIKSYYATWKEASNATIKLGISSAESYRSNYKQDKKLPSLPNETYEREWKNNKRWIGFLGKSNPNPYNSWKEASIASINLNLKSGNEYRRNYRNDPHLPYFPERVYSKEWESMGGWEGFLELPNNSIYESWNEAVNAVKNLSIKTASEYKLRFNEDPRLRSNPKMQYPLEWLKFDGWNGYLSKKNPIFYKTWLDASNAAMKLGIKTQPEYRSFHKQDEKLPPTPSDTYHSEWDNKGKWRGFLSGKDCSNYKTYKQASEATLKLGIRSSNTYVNRYKEDPKLPSQPMDAYPIEWHKNSAWRGFLGIDREIYTTWQEASNAAKNLGITSKEEYKETYTLDNKLRSNPSHYYSDDWNKNGSWDGFLAPNEINTFKKASQAAKYLGITSEKEYAERYKDYPFGKLPRHPERWKYLEDGEWLSWPHFLGVDFYTYDELINFIRNTPEVQNSSTYKDYRTSSRNKKLPASPNEYYDEWINWYIASGKNEPYQSKFIREPYTPWKNSIEDFMRIARGGGQKMNSLCKFERDFIEKEGLGHSPESFLLESGARNLTPDATKGLLDKYRDFLNGITSTTGTDTQYKVNQATCEYLEWVIVNKLSVDNDLGESIPLVTNPLKHINIKMKWGGWSKKTFETNKNILPYQYLKDAREWIIPTKAINFSDLKHLYNNFDSDWLRVEESIIDKNDPDCVWELRQNAKLGPQYYLWQPVTWVHTYALMQTPYRGYQIAYSDSGEADSEIPITDTNKNISWIKNPLPLSGLTTRQGFIRKFPQGEIGTYLTTNKTHDNGAGYEIPWLDEELAYWIIKLRSWQVKYNPIEKPTSWTELTRVNINEEQASEKGSNCFLFRAPGQFEAASFQAYLDRRLAVSLYHIQDSSIELASVPPGKKRSTSNYNSIYTPHSIRASMITAFLMDFGLPPHIVMKIVGHSTLITTAYYVKLGKEKLREVMTIGEKRALQRKATNQIILVQQGEIDSIKNQLTGNSEEVLAGLSSTTPAANFTFTDYGLCPFAGARCNEGGPMIGNSKIHGSVPEGYLGIQNCLQCRFFITGPAFLGGLLSIANELFFEANKQSEHMEDLRLSLDEIKSELRNLDIKQYDAEKHGDTTWNNDEKYSIEIHKNKLASELERATKKIDMYLCDLNFSHKLINQCKDLVNDEVLSHDESEVKLVKQQDFNLCIEPQETTHFHQLSEICSNAEFYESANAKSAIYPRSQMLDRMATLNGMDPILLMLNEKQQLAVGNQMSELLLSRLKSWGKIDKVISGSILLSDLNDDQRITPLEIKELVTKKIGVKNGNS